jgi:hypothetical protein
MSHNAKMCKPSGRHQLPSLFAYVRHILWPSGGHNAPVPSSVLEPMCGLILTQKPRGSFPQGEHVPGAFCYFSDYALLDEP